MMKMQFYKLIAYIGLFSTTLPLLVLKFSLAVGRATVVLVWWKGMVRGGGGAGEAVRNKCSPRTTGPCFAV